LNSLHVLDQRRIEIETGYGMEGILPDVKCLWIVKEIAVPAGNVIEQALGSASYDVWVCECGRESVESYQGSTSADKCDVCGYLTDRVTESRTLQRATTESTGLYGITRQCAHRDRTRTDTRIIRRRREKSNDFSHDSGGSMSSGSSGSSAGSGSSSGGSFGGGRSGGGGAGSSY
jgi:uncharacterized protein